MNKLTAEKVRAIRAEELQAVQDYMSELLGMSELDALGAWLAMEEWLKRRAKALR